MAIMTSESGIMGCSDQGTGIFYYQMNSQGTLDFKVVCSSIPFICNMPLIIFI